MSKAIIKDAIRKLQKDGDFRFSVLTRAVSKTAVAELAEAAMNDDRSNGIESCFGVGRDAFGYYFAAQIKG